MLAFLTLIFCCQLAGELIAGALHLQVPGPVVGMALLFCGLVIKGGIPDDLGQTADALISNLSLLFIPAGVGVMLHARLIGQDWIPLSVALVVSTALTIMVTAWMMRWLSPRSEQQRRDEKEI